MQEIISNYSLLIANYNYNYCILAIVLYFLQIGLIVLYLSDFRLSFSRLILILLFFVVVLLICFLFILSPDVVFNIGDNNNIGTNVKLEGQVHVHDGEAGKSLANHVGILGGMGIGAGTVGKATARASMPPLAKVGLVLSGALAGGVFEKAINNSGNVGASSAPSINNGTISKLVGNSQISVLQENFFLYEVGYFLVLYMVILLVGQLIFKLYFKDNIKLNLSKLLGNNLNNKVEYYLNKIIHLNKKMSIFWTWFGILAITYVISRSIYGLHLMRVNIDNLVNAHLSLHPLKDNLHVTDRSIEEMLSYLQWNSYICLIILVLLMIQIICKFNLKHGIKLNLSLILGVKINNWLEYNLDNLFLLIEK